MAKGKWLTGRHILCESSAAICRGEVWDVAGWGDRGVDMNGQWGWKEGVDMKSGCT